MTSAVIKTLPNKTKKLYEQLANAEAVKASTPTKAADGPSVVRIMAKIAQNGHSEKFFKLMEGDWSGYNSQSQADLALCSILAQHTSSADTIDRIFRDSNLVRAKWDEPHDGGKRSYGEMTIRKALSNVASATEEFNAQKSSHHEIALEVIKKIGRENIKYYAHDIWRWNQKKGLWVITPDEVIKKRIIRIASGKNITSSHVESILKFIKTEAHSTIDYFNRKRDWRVINCLNGEAHFEGGKWALKEHNRESYFIYQIPVNFDETAKCPRFTQFFDEVFAPDPDKKEKVKLLQEFAGYSLTTSCEYERSLLLIGGGKNGKGVFLRALIAMLGEKNVAGVQLNQFEEKFSIAHLHGKLANIATEIDAGAIFPDAKYKAITSGELMNAQHKYGKLFDFKPYSTLFFATNHLPHTRDTTYAFFRRTEIIKFNVQFDGDKCDTTLDKKLVGELPGILNFALAGLQRLQKNRDFTKVVSCIQMKQTWERSADQVKSFVDDECVLDRSAKIPTADLYNAYVKWTEESGIKSPLNKNNFSSKLEHLDCEHHRDGKVRSIIGIKLKSP